MSTKVSAVLAAVVMAMSSVAFADDDDAPKTTLYFTRHGDDQKQLVSTGKGTFKENCNPLACCVEVLNPLGVERAARLADWFAKEQIRIEMVIATHKPRTVATVRAVAANRSLNGAADTYIDQVPGDGVRQVPATPTECSPGFEASNSNLSAMTAYLHALPAGTTALVGAHSTTVYQLLNSFGINTSNPVDFPGSATKVVGFNNLWKIEIDSSGNGKLKKHYVLDFQLNQTELQSTEHHENNGHDGDDDDD